MGGGWQGMTAPSWRGSWEAPGVRLPASQWQCQQHGGCTNGSPAFSVGPTARGALPPLLHQQSVVSATEIPRGASQGSPSQGHGGWVVRRGLCPGGTRGLAPGQECTAGSGPLLGPTDPGLPSTRHPVSSPSSGGDQAMDGRHYQTVLDRRTRSNRVWWWVTFEHRYQTVLESSREIQHCPVRCPQRPRYASARGRGTDVSAPQPAGGTQAWRAGQSSFSSFPATSTHRGCRGRAWALC
ncbi:uncharacterized protein LOC118881461 isoform X1 [Balaenoptera musculus]|uniref:Uncharacterized protein LOC118881461 isoform X1 n=1 Tax=Balaenoptera musculus TaxID=9771 RepID=A0A8B8VBZ1_BALMU|nr:uncharacterized protein LOC118881461 isoform X1 [Balaenoptera musculus]